MVVRKVKQVGGGPQPRLQPNKPPNKGLATTLVGPSRTGLSPINATLAVCGVIAGINAHLWGGLDWRGLNRSELPPKAKEKDPENQKK